MCVGMSFYCKKVICFALWTFIAIRYFAERLG